MESYRIGNNFINNNYGSRTARNPYSGTRFPGSQSTYSQKQFPTFPEKNPGDQVFETYQNLCALIDVLENKIHIFQVSGNFAGLHDKFLKDLRDLVNKLRKLKENLSLDNLESTLAELKSLGKDNFELLQQLVNMENKHTNNKSAAMPSYMFSFYDRVNEKKVQSLGIDVYY